MSSRKKRPLSAANLRVVLGIILLLIAGGGIAIFYFGYQQVINYSKETDVTAQQAAASAHVVQDLMALRKELDAQQNIQQGISSMTADSADYHYQEQIIETVTAHASSAGVALDNISFATAAQAGQAGATAGTTTTTPTTEPTRPSGLQSATATITLANPVNYSKLLNFLYALENSALVLNTASLTLTKSSSDASGNSVDCGPLSIEVYLR